ncbi:hypothetical protein [Mycobacteroides abscessus]|nr:hypothetical protein [Mycobacteroides abscessus]
MCGAAGLSFTYITTGADQLVVMTVVLLVPPPGLEPGTCGL